MAVVYLDWNVFVGLRTGEIDTTLHKALRRLTDERLAVVPFTNEHVLEAVRGLGDDEEASIERNRRLTHIAEVTRNVHWSFEPETGQNVFSIIEPAQAYSEMCVETLPRSTELPEGALRRDLEAIEDDARRMMEAVNGTIRELSSRYRVDLEDLSLTAAPRTDFDILCALHALAEAERRAARTMTHGPLGINAIRINSPKSEADVLWVLRRQIEATEGATIESLMTDVEARYGGPSCYRPSQLNALLQLAGFARDRSSRSIANLSSDGTHLNYALRSQFFVTTDARLRRRASLIAECLAAQTVVLSPQDAISMLASAVEG